MFGTFDACSYNSNISDLLRENKLAYRVCIITTMTSVEAPWTKILYKCGITTQHT